MAYVKKNWVLGETIEEVDMDHLETQYDEMTNLFDAQTILAAVSDNTPVALTVAASRILGRKASGNIAAMTVGELLTLINVAAGADVTGSNAPQAHKASHQNGGGDEVSATGLSGLLADDQHVLDSEVLAVAISKTLMTTRGDLIYRNATVPARLAKGTEGHVLKQGANDPVWSTTANRGSYSGNDSADRAIPHGLGVAPSVVLIVSFGANLFICLRNDTITKPLTPISYTTSRMDGTNFYVGNATSYANSANATGETYVWVAI